MLSIPFCTLLKKALLKKEKEISHTTTLVIPKTHRKRFRIRSKENEFSRFTFLYFQSVALFPVLVYFCLRVSWAYNSFFFFSVLTDKQLSLSLSLSLSLRISLWLLNSDLYNYDSSEGQGNCFLHIYNKHTYNGMQQRSIIIGVKYW